MWACDKGDKVRHFYIQDGAECAPACYPESSMLRELSKGAKKPKCKACQKVRGES